MVSSAILFSGCSPIAPSNATNISLGQAITLSQNNNISDARREADNGWIIMTVQIDGDPITVVDEKGVPVSVNNGDHLFAYTGGMNTADLKDMGLFFPNFSVSQGAPVAEARRWIIYALFPIFFSDYYYSGLCVWAEGPRKIK
jgi:hypothetical protein